MFLRFFFPRVLFEPKSVFKIGYPSDFSFGVDTKYQKDYRIWVVRNAEGMFVIYARCTHLGCTPDWIASENKFKCPCHGSGYDSEGINFEGPAPRPLDRAKVELDADGQVIVGAGWFGPNEGTSRATYWLDGGAIQRLDTLLTAWGLDLGGMVLSGALGVSDDGLVFTGTGWLPGDPDAFSRAWIAGVPSFTPSVAEPVSAALIGVGLAGIALGRHRRK